MKTGYRLRLYSHPRLRWVVRSKIAGRWVRKYFEKRTDAQTYCELKNVELFNQGRDSMEFPASLRLMAQEAFEMLAPHGKTIADAVAFYLAHLESSTKSAKIAAAVTELVENRKATDASSRYCHDLKLRLGRFIEDFPERTVDGFSSKEIDEWLVGLQLAPVTRNTFRRDLRTLFSFCSKRGILRWKPGGAYDRCQRGCRARGHSNGRRTQEAARRRFLRNRCLPGHRSVRRIACS